MSDDQDVLVEYNGALLALDPADADRFIGDSVIVPCSTCTPPCSYYHVSPDRIADWVIAAGRPVSARLGYDQVQRAPNAPINPWQSQRR
jgi:hypothetical protein